MARRYAVNGTDTNTASTTMGGISATTAVRPMIYDIIVSSAATPADNACEYHVKRFTTAPTWTAVTPNSLDPNEVAAITSAGQNATGEPTYASTYLLDFAVNQRATFRWVASPGGELRVPATANNGASIVAAATGGAATTMVFTIHFEE